MLLTRRALLLLLLDALLLAGATFEPLLLYLAVAYVLVVLAMLLADRRLTPAPRDFALRRIHDARLSLGAQNLVVVRVEHHGRRAVRLLVRDEYPPQFRADRITLGAPVPRARLSVGRRGIRRVLAPGAETDPARIAPRAALELRYHVRPPRRGDYAFGDLNLRWWGVLGLIVRQARFPAAAPVKVYPNLLDIRKYELLVRRGKLQEMGLRQTRRLGAGTEFERLREYQPDDEFRRIDWKAMARRGKPITREFQTERSQTIIAMLDVGRLMRSPVGDLEKVDYVVNAVLMLSYVAGLRGDRVGMLAFDDGVRHYLAPRSGKGQFYRMLALLYGIESQPVEADYKRAFAYLGARHKKRALIIVFSDLASGLGAQSLIAQVAPLYPRHLPLLVAIADPSVVELARLAPADSANVYQRAVAEMLRDERALLMERLRRGGVLTLDVPADALTVALVNKYLELKARGRI